MANKTEPMYVHADMVVNLEGLSEMTGTTLQTLRKHVQSGKIPAVRVSRGRYLVYLRHLFSEDKK